MPIIETDFTTFPLIPHHIFFSWRWYFFSYLHAHYWNRLYHISSHNQLMFTSYFIFLKILFFLFFCMPIIVKTPFQLSCFMS
jgi:hypothetical protein